MSYVDVRCRTWQESRCPSSSLEDSHAPEFQHSLRRRHPLCKTHCRSGWRRHHLLRQTRRLRGSCCRLTRAARAGQAARLAPPPPCCQPPKPNHRDGLYPDSLPILHPMRPRHQVQSRFSSLGRPGQRVTSHRDDRSAQSPLAGFQA